MALDANSTSSAALRDVEGALGSLGDLIEIDAEKRVAVQVALGDALSAVVAKNIDAARRALQELRQSGSVGAVLALNAITTVPNAPTINNGVSIRSSVRAKAGENEVQINRLLDVLLSRVVFVQSWADAVDAALAHPEMVVITGDGDKFASSGLRIGASGVTAAALEEAQRRAERAADLGERGESAPCRVRHRPERSRPPPAAPPAPPPHRPSSAAGRRSPPRRPRSPRRESRPRSPARPAPRAGPLVAHARPFGQARAADRRGPRSPPAISWRRTASP